MTNQEALNVLIQGVQVAQQKGAYNLQDAKLIAEAVETFTKLSPVTGTQDIPVKKGKKDENIPNEK